GERSPGRIPDREVVEPGRATRWRSAATALPGVHPDVMVIAASGYEGRLRPEALLQLEAEHVAVEGERAVDVSDLEMDVPDVDTGIDRRKGVLLGCARLLHRAPESTHARTSIVGAVSGSLERPYAEATAAG